MSAYSEIAEQENITKLDLAVIFWGEEDPENEGEPAAQELLDLRARLAKARELLKQAEWEGVEERHYACPICGAFREHGHERNCELAAFLKGVE